MVTPQPQLKPNPICYLFFYDGRFKGVDDKANKFICRPVIGYSRGPFPRFSKQAIFKLKVFGVGVMEEPTRRNRWERLPEQSKDRYILSCLFMPFIIAELICLFV